MATYEYPAGSMASCKINAEGDPPHASYTNAPAMSCYYHTEGVPLLQSTLPDLQRPGIPIKEGLIYIYEQNTGPLELYRCELCKGQFPDVIEHVNDLRHIYRYMKIHHAKVLKKLKVQRHSFEPEELKKIVFDIERTNGMKNLSIYADDSLWMGGIFDSDADDCESAEPQRKMQRTNQQSIATSDKTSTPSTSCCGMVTSTPAKTPQGSEDYKQILESINEEKWTNSEMDSSTDETSSTEDTDVIKPKGVPATEPGTQDFPVPLDAVKGTNDYETCCKKKNNWSEEAKRESERSNQEVRQ
ncbi:Hypothetical predicted protein [Pelobates cultripes]|uniref:Uncharacterized protein n=1 Tax=Pelobates cultripes TaxID=61616 RepID=A0AAD1RYJ5_PELCU|nr:Hypothetical predicted protein [Pelobates cultripes]